MQEFNILIGQVAVLMIWTALGYIAGKTGYMPKDSGPFISKMVIRITSPALILNTMTSYNFDSKTLSDSLLIGLMALLFISFSLLAGIVSGRLIRLKGTAYNVFKVHSMFGNISYLALPLFKTVFGDRAVVYAVFYVLVNEVLVWTAGIYLLNEHQGHFSSTLRKFINQNTIVCMIGLVFALFNLQQYFIKNAAAKYIFDIFHGVTGPLGSCTLPLVMLYVGLSTAADPDWRFRNILKKPVTLSLTFVKLLIIPLLSLGVLMLFGSRIDPFVRTIVIMELAMPCAAVIVPLSAEYGSDHRQAADNVIYTTIFSLFTLPLFLLLLNYIH